MTVAAFHRSFWHAVMKRLGELSAHLLVAREAESRLPILQQTFAEPALFDRKLRHLEELRQRDRRPHGRRWIGRFDKMSAVARLAGHAGCGVQRMIESLQALELTHDTSDTAPSSPPASP
jgi:hypothetical protein